MKQKINEWLDKPWTNRTYVKICGVVLGIYGAMIGVMVIASKIKDRAWVKEYQAYGKIDKEFDAEE